MNNNEKFVELIEKLRRSPMYNLSLADQSEFHLHFFYWLVNTAPTMMTEFFSNVIGWEIQGIIRAGKEADGSLGIYLDDEPRYIVMFYHSTYNRDKSADDEYFFPSMWCYQIPEPEPIYYKGCDIMDIVDFLDKYITKNEIEQSQEVYIRDYMNYYRGLIELCELIDHKMNPKEELYSDLFNRSNYTYNSLKALNFHRSYESEAIDSFMFSASMAENQKLATNKQANYGDFQFSNISTYKSENKSYECFFEFNYFCKRGKIRIYCRPNLLAFDALGFVPSYLHPVSELIDGICRSIVKKHPKIYKHNAIDKSNYSKLRIEDGATQEEVLNTLSEIFDELELGMSTIKPYVF